MRTSTSLLILILSTLMHSCYKGKQVDLIVHNAEIHIMDEGNHIAEAMAIKDGKIVEVGPERQILNKYSAEEEIDAEGKAIYPGLTDCHGHLLSYARQKLSVDLTGCKSKEEMIVRVEKYQAKFKRKFIYGRGWDQSLWQNDSFPDNTELNKLFPNTPVCLERIDGHAVLANEACLKIAEITPASEIPGGIIVLNSLNKCTGLLIDRAMETALGKVPDFSQKEVIAALKEIEQELYQYGITGVHEAGIEYPEIDLLKKLISQHDFRVELYAMLFPSGANISFARKNGIYTFKNLLIRSFKVMGDGALGSRGAFLKHPYHDMAGHHGVLTTPISEMKRVAKICQETGYQMNTHAIGDSTNRILLDLYAGIFETNKDHRWRIEHAQVVDVKDFDLFSKYGVFPSVQPVHAVSDQRWAEKRLGTRRMKGAYAYKTLLDRYGMLAIGTDFPVEYIDPYMTIHAAVHRKNSENFPAQGFYINERISLLECLKGMTSWAAFSSFQENVAGTLEKGKYATFFMPERPLETDGMYSPNFSLLTVIRGERVYSTN
jgi:predicted amidohydrolase YtcJ